MSDIKTYPIWDGDDAYAERAAPAPFGYQVMLDLYDCREKILGNLSQVYGFLELLVGALHMTKQAPPFVFLSPPEYLDKQGISGWVPLVESGIQIHTLLARRFVSVDIYCCHQFDAAVAKSVAQNMFGPCAIDMQEIQRGRKYRWGAG